MIRGIIHCHSEYSILDSTISIKELVSFAAENGCKAIALTDHGTMLGVPSFMKECENNGIKGIPGVEAYIEEEDEGRRHLIILPKDNIGYQAISNAVTMSNQRLYTDKQKNSYPRMNKEILLDCFGPGSKGYGHVLFLSACVSGILSAILLHNESIRGKIEKIKKAQNKFLSPNSPELKRINIRLDKIQEDILNMKETKDRLRKGEERYTEKLEFYKKELKKASQKEKALKAELKKTEKSIEKYLQCESKIQILRRQYHGDCEEEALQEAAFYKKLGDFYIELQYHGLPQEAEVMPKLYKIAQKLNIPLVATNDCHYVYEEDYVKRQYLQSIRFGHWVEDDCRQLYIKEDTELYRALRQILPEAAVVSAMDNIPRILDGCDVKFDRCEHYPTYIGPEDFDTVIEQGIQERISKSGMVWDEPHKERLKQEQSVIKGMGYVDYFMNVRQIMEFARKIGNVPYEKCSDIPNDPQEAIRFAAQFPCGVSVGPGRGSAVGSLVSYIMGITEIDPLEYGLLFERFLNADRVTMPDIDVDIRPEIIPSIYHFLQQIRGCLAVSKITTKIRFDVKEAIRSAGRLLFSKTGEVAYKKEASTLAERYDEFPETSLSSMGKEIIEIAKKEKGFLVSTGVHAAGVIISDTENLSDFVPLSYNMDNACWTVQCDMTEAEECGLLKMDLLKLVYLSICSECIQNVPYNIDWDHIPFEKEVFESIYSSGHTNCIFQCESPGMRKTVEEFGPESIQDLVLLVAAYRPGPMDFIPDMIAVKHGRKTPDYVTEKIEPILSETYGAILFQEQVMRIFQELAGYSMGDADLVRRAMAKKKPEKLEIEKQAFIYGDAKRKIKGCMENGLSRDQAEKLFMEMSDFAKYAFNKSHAVAYAIVSYRSAYLKYHFPAEYLCAYLNYKPKEVGKVVEECFRMNIQVRKPEINLSKARNCIQDGSIRLGFAQIFQVASASYEIEREREKNGFFSSKADFAARIQVKKNVLKNLEDCGAFQNLPDAAPLEDMILKERKLLGAFFSREALKIMIGEQAPFDRDQEYRNISITGIAIETEEKVLKDERLMGMLRLGTAEDVLPVVLFPDIYERQKEILKEGAILRIHGAYKRGEFGFQVIAKGIHLVFQDIYYITRKDLSGSLPKQYESPYGSQLLILEPDGTYTRSGRRFLPGILEDRRIHIVPKL